MQEPNRETVTETGRVAPGAARRRAAEGIPRPATDGAGSPHPDSAGPAPAADAAGVREPPSLALRVVETAQTIVTAFILALVFRAFLVEAFIIPTGSMAPSLLGRHASQTCAACGWEYDFVPAQDALCPNCHWRASLPAQQAAHKDGDRLLVHKWPYVLGGPLGLRRWDVIVFRNPANPVENYIKRLVGLPGETVEIIGGDVFIDGRIARKTPAAQKALWFVVFDQDRYPHAGAAAAQGPRWVPEAPGDEGEPGWRGLQTRVIRYEGHDAVERGLLFQPAGDLTYFQDVCAYNRGVSPDAPFVRDVRILGEATFRDGAGALRLELRCDGRTFAAEVGRTGTVTLTLPEEHEGAAGRRLTKQVRGFTLGRPYVIEFGHVDYRVYLKIDGRDLWPASQTEYSPRPGAARARTRGAPVGLRLSAVSLSLELRGLRVDRDVYYTTRPEHGGRAQAGVPFGLGRDEFFVLGDNSPDSRDSREWNERSPYLGPDYRLGTVRRNQIVGRGAFVYLPSLMPLDSSGRWWIPNVGRMRFIR